MDQESLSFPEPISVPKIVAPQNNESFDGQTVTISGTADRDVLVRVWDWLSPVASTTADGNGDWSVTLHDVEVGDHMYGAEALRESQAPSGRSTVVAVRVASHTRSSAEPARRTSRRWKLPTTEFARKFAGRGRSDGGSDDAGQIALEESRESNAIGARPAPVPTSAHTPLPSAPTLPPAEGPPLPESTPLHADLPLDPVPEHEKVAEPPPIEVGASMVAEEPGLIEGSPWTEVQRPAPIDLGMVEPVPDPVPALEADTQIEAVPPASQRIWTERVIVKPPPSV